MTAEPLRLMTVHAHPDDESSKGAATLAKYHDEGVETVLVCCTGGEQGEILNPAMDREDIRSNLHAVRMDELQAAAKVIGFDHVELMGYRDSGMAGSEANADPRSFAQAPLAEATGKLVTLIRRHKPQVIITYGDDQEFYPHPDHLRTHEVTVAAFEAAGDANAFPEAGQPWQPSKLYYSLFSKLKLTAMWKALENEGVELPVSIDQLGDVDAQITTVVDVIDHLNVRRDALLAHATQIAPDSALWFGLPADEEQRVHGSDEYILARSTVQTLRPEDDLFAGLR